MSDTAVEDLVVTEIGCRVAAAVCGSLLAQIGARVIVPELPVDFAEGKDRYRAQFMAGKLSIAPRLEDKDDIALLRAIIDGSDVIITSSDVDLGQQVSDLLAETRPDQIICDITAFGEGGPASRPPATDLQMQAISGILDTTGLPDHPPVAIRFPIVEFMTGVYAAAGSLAAVRARRASGLGQKIDMALYDCAFASMATFLPRLLDGSNASVVRVGNRHSMASPWNVYAAQDGWLLICAASDEQWQRVCRVIDRQDLAEDPGLARVADRVARCTEVDKAVQAWVEQQTVAKCRDELGAANIAWGAVTPIDGHPREDNLHHRVMVVRLRDPDRDEDIFLPASPLGMRATPGRAPAVLPRLDGDREQVRSLLDEARSVMKPKRNASTKMPFAGVRVVEIGHYTTAPLSARHFANLGAEVIKVEPPEGEAVRGWPPAKRGQGYFFTYTNSDKRSLVLDLRSEEGLNSLRDLLAKSDVLIENLKPGTLAKRGLSAAEIAHINPRLIYCAVSGFGDHSIYKGRPAFDSVIQAMSGIMDLTRSGDIPVKSGISSADLIGAQMAVVAVTAAMEYRDRTGRGQYIDLSMQDAAAWMTMTQWNGGGAGTAPVLLEASDGHVLVEPRDAAKDPRQCLRPEAGASVTRDGMVTALERRGYRATAVRSAREALESRETKARHLVFWATDDRGEDWPLLASPLRLQGTPPIVRLPMPELGRDTSAILAELKRI